MPNFNTVLDHLSSLSPKKRGQAFELYCKWFLENDPSYAMQIKKVWLWNDWPGCWGRDKGIDLIAETHNGEHWAIQAKAYDEGYYITKNDVDTFLSESSRKTISFRLLIATTNNLGPNPQEVISGQEKPVGLCLLDHLEESAVDWSQAIHNPTTPATKEVRSPWPHQALVLKDIITGFEQSSYGQLYMACGTGKTLVGLWLAERLKSNTTLVLVPSISLVAQLYREWSSFNSEAFNFYPIFVCSDTTVSKRGDDDSDSQTILHSAELGFPVTTSAYDIVKELSRTPGPKVIFSTYHSSPVIAKACKLDPSLSFDLAIADEAHRCAGPASSDFATIVDKEAIRTKRKLFMTATHKIFTDRVKNTAKECDYEIVSMDDHDKFGPIFHQLLFSDAIKDGLLSDYQVIVSVIDNKTYQEYAERGRFVAFDDHETDARTLASQLMVAKAIKQYNLTKIISFHSRTKSARAFIDSLPKALSLLPENERPTINFSDTIFSDIPQSDRSKILKRFKEPMPRGAAILANVRCLSEGVDVQELEGIAFIDPKGSEIDIVQAVGRVIRKPKNSAKKIGTILIPVFVDTITDEVLALEQSSFKTVWRVVKALRAHDDVLAEELDTIRLELGKRTYKSPSRLSKIVIDLPVTIGVEFGDALRIKIIDDIITNCSSSWMFQFNLLKEFQRSNPYEWPSLHTEFPEGNNLGHWCSTQRQDYRKGILIANRIELLNSIGFPWQVQTSKWDKQFNILKQFRQIYPDRWPEKREYFPANNKIGAWCIYQRQRLFSGKLKQEKINKLNSIDFLWDPLKDDWDKQFTILKEFRRLNPNKWPSAKTEFPKGNKLGIWCSQKRQAYKKEMLEPWKIEALESIQFVWDPLKEDWSNQFENLQLYRAHNPNKWPEQRESFPEGNKLGVWCHTQRKSFKSSPNLCVNSL